MRLLGKVESGLISVDLVGLLASMAAAHCVCLLSSFTSGNPGDSENSG